MSKIHRVALCLAAVVLVSLTLVTAPAEGLRGADLQTSSPSTSITAPTIATRAAATTPTTRSSANAGAPGLAHFLADEAPSRAPGAPPPLLDLPGSAAETRLRF